MIEFRKPSGLCGVNAEKFESKPIPEQINWFDKLFS